MTGWIKWHLDAMDNEMFYNDWTAWHLFEYLCLMAYRGKPQGVVVTGRDKIAKHIGGNSSTIYKALKRLEKAKMVTVSVTGRKSTIYICNWVYYQHGGNSSSNRKVTEREQNGNTLNKNKIKNKDILPKGNVETLKGVQQLYELFIKLWDKNPNQYTLTPARKKKLATRIKQNGLEQVKQAIEATAQSDWHMGDNDRGWIADLDFIIRSQEQVEKLSQMGATKLKDIKEYV